MSCKLFDLEHLQQLTYERSKTWASFLDNVAKNETLEEIDINNLDKVYGPEFDEDDTHEELASMEDDECDDVTVDSEILKNVTNTTRFSLLFNNKTLALPEGAKSEENNKLFDIFNQTIPVINEHNRQMKESGFERILSTFDKQKIEDKVGSWLNRHNTLYGGDNTLLYTVSKMKDSKKKEYQTKSATRLGTGNRSCRTRSPNKKEVSNDSDDSLQSGETARYIRSSRAGAIKNASSTTTMIKTYRMVRSTREALREKYACEKADDEYHLKSVRHRRRFANDLEYHHNHYDLARLQKSRKHEMATLPPPSSVHKDRRKVLRKRTYSNSCSTIDSSSDSDQYYDEDRRFHRKHLASCCNQHHYSARRNNYTSTTAPKNVAKRVSQRSAVKMPSARLNRMYYYTHSQTKSLSSSSSSTSASFSSASDRRRAIKNNCNFYTDNRPCRRESDCRCCNERNLCEEYKHVADTSTDEWYVENCCSPKKSLKTPSSSHSNPTYKALTYETEQLPVLTEKMDEDDTTKQNKKTISLKNASVKRPKQKSKTTKSTTTSNAACTIEDEIFDRELQMAIEASKELYEKEQETKTNQDSVKTKEKHEIIPTKPLRKTSKKTDQKQNEFKEQKKSTARKREITKNRSAIDKEDEVIEKLPKLLDEVKVEIIDLSDDDKNFIRPKPVSAKMPATKNKNSTITTTEETFFAPTPTQVICNSTALSSKSTAYCRQITDKLPGEDNESNKVSKTKKSKIQLSLKTTKKKATSSSSTISANKLQTKKTAASTTVTSTTIRSPEINSTLTTTETQTKEIIPEVEMSSDELSDCTLVTSTTNIEPPPLIEMQPKLEDSQPQDATLNSNYPRTQKGILIYAPQNRSMVPAHSFTNDGYFTITKEHLSSVIGEKPAEKFLKYYIGRKRFNRNSTIYFRPPAGRSLDSNNMSSSSDSDDDLDSLGQYGDLYESLNKS
ncbi:uncharacterized protein cal1 [Calliphora vicina]|uniref:uncharacterized protein cal1 n=1 Tax=Calliphora vicina TaxID=7373 RepID=UPI00325B7A09